MGKKGNNSHKQQKDAMKRRRKHKARVNQIARALLGTSQLNVLKHAREYPIYECLINPDWDVPDTEDSGLVRILLSRQQPNGLLTVGSFLMDIYCLGLKDTFVSVDTALSDYSARLVPGIYMDVDPVACPVGLAHEIIYRGIEYAARFAFSPNKDFKTSQYVLDPRGTHPETHGVQFGRDGKPLFVAGPYDNVRAIMRKLETHARPGNYDFIHPLLMDDDDLQDEAEDDEDEKG